MLLVVIVAFTICWSPRFLVSIIKWLAQSEGGLQVHTCIAAASTKLHLFQFNVSRLFLYFSQIAKLLPFIHAMMNPVIYW